MDDSTACSVKFDFIGESYAELPSGSTVTFFFKVMIYNFFGSTAYKITKYFFLLLYLKTTQGYVKKV